MRLASRRSARRCTNEQAAQLDRGAARVTFSRTERVKISPGVLSRLRDHRHARRAGSAAGRRAALRRRAGQHLAGRDRVGAEDRARKLRPARADEAGERRRSRRARTSSEASTDAARDEPANGEHDRRIGSRRPLGRERRGQRPAEHRLDERLLGRLATVRVVSTSRPSRSTVTASASSSTSRRKWEIRRIVVPAAASERTTSWSCSVSGPLERSRRLVHDDHTSVARERAQDLDLLLLGRAEAPGRSRARKVEAGRLGELVVAPPQRAPAHEPASPRLRAEQDVLGHGQHRRRPRAPARSSRRRARAPPSASRTRPAFRRAACARRRRRARRRRSCRASTCRRRSRRSSACTEPRATASETPSSARTPPKCLETSWSSI